MAVELPAWLSRARTLDERLAAVPAAPVGAASETAPGPVDGWLRAVAAGDHAAFGRRLDWDGWEAVQAAAALGGPWTPEQPLPDWTDWLERALQRVPRVLAEIARDGRVAEEDLFPVGKPLPFLELWVPFLRCAREALKAQACSRLFSPKACGDLERRLLSDLALWGATTAYESFEGWRGRHTGAPAAGAERPLYLSFVRACLERHSGLLAGRPALARRLATATVTWVDAVGELGRRLLADLPCLEELFAGGQPLGPVTGIETGLSEPHGGGRRVLALTFAAGAKLVYKPRPVNVEAGFQDLLRWLAARRLGPVPPAHRVIARDGYGWCEWVERSGVPDAAAAERYFERAGALLCLAEILGGDDLHAENVVATADGPVLVDAETLLQPRQAEPRPADPPRLRSQLATSPQLDAAGRPFDLGGLQGYEERLAERDRRFWRLPNTDAMTVERGPAFVPPGANVLLLRGRPCLPSRQARPLARGFEAAYRFLLDHREELLAPQGPLAGLQAKTVRVLLRTSQDYGYLVGRLRESRFQDSGLSGGLLLETANRAFTADRRRPAGWEVTTAERLALERGDIPRFEARVDGTAVILPDSRMAPGCFAVSGWDALRARFGRMSDDDLAAWLREVRRLGRRRVRQGVAPASMDASPADFVAHAVALGHRLFGDGVPTLPETTGRGLYGGRLGVLLFAAALAREEGGAVRDCGWVAAAVRTELARPAGRDLGLFAGLGGELYAAALISHWLRDPAPAAAAGTRLRRLRQRRFDEAPLDLAGGLAGFLLGALAFAAVTGDAEASDLALLAGARLATRLEAAAPAQPGVAHGSAGIALALARLARTTGDPAWLGPARRAFDLEAVVRSGEPGFGPGLTRHGHGWCRGVAGMGLVALELALASPGADRPVELSVALSCIGETPGSDLDGPCCGAPGEIELLLAAGAAPGRPRVEERSRRMRATWLHRLRTSGPVLAHDQLGRRRVRSGLFRGLSGVGYTLLRCGRPEDWPSLLLFQAPSNMGREVMR